jgi:hypothetical protein
MPYSLCYDKEIDSIILVFENSINISVIQEVAPQVARICKETGCWRILNDMRAASIDMSMMHLFDYLDFIDKSSISGTAKSALLFPSDFYDSRILEPTTHNRGDNLKVFFDVTEAREWLLGKT